MSDWLLCLVGRHDWDEFGECRRNWQHVQMQPGDTLRGLGHLMAGTDWTDGPYGRVAKRRHDAKMARGLDLQRQLAALGEDVSLELCKNAAWNGYGDALIAVVEDSRRG